MSEIRKLQWCTKSYDNLVHYTERDDLKASIAMPHVWSIHFHYLASHSCATCLWKWGMETNGELEWKVKYITTVRRTEVQVLDLILLFFINILSEYETKERNCIQKYIVVKRSLLMR